MSMFMPFGDYFMDRKYLVKHGLFACTQRRWNALDYLQNLGGAAIWCPRMQGDGFRIDNNVNYLTQFSDFSGNGNDAIQATSTAQAYLSTVGATFSGAQYYAMDSAAVSGTAVRTLCFSVTPSSTAPNQQYEDILNIGAPNASSAWGLSCVTNSAEYFGGIYWGSKYVTSATRNGGVRSNVIVTGDGTTETFYVNGVSVGSHENTRVLGTTQTVIGGRFLLSDVSSEFFSGDISAIALYNKTLTTAEQSVVNQCLTILGA